MALTQRQPDITYHPDFEKYQLRTERIKLQRSANPGLPAEFPAQLAGGLVWEGKDFTDKRQWTLVLNDSQLEEIRIALEYFKGNYRSGSAKHLL